MSLCDRLNMPHGVPVYHLKKRFLKLSLVRHPDHRGTPDAFVHLERDHCILSHHGNERCEAADDILSFNSNHKIWNFLICSFAEKGNFLAVALFCSRFLALCQIRLTLFRGWNKIRKLKRFLKNYENNCVPKLHRLRSMTNYYL